MGCIFLTHHDKIKLCHFPPTDLLDTRDIEREQRYTHLRPTIADDEYLLCGHVHSREHLLAKNIYHVGVDAAIHNYAPVSLYYVLDTLKEAQNA